MKFLFFTFSIFSFLLSNACSNQAKHIIIGFNKEMTTEEMKKNIFDEFKQFITYNFDENLYDKIIDDRFYNLTFLDDVFAITNICYREYFLLWFRNRYIKNIPSMFIQLDIEDDLFRTLRTRIQKYSSPILNINLDKIEIYKVICKKDERTFKSHLFYVAKHVLDRIIENVDLNHLKRVVQVRSELWFSNKKDFQYGEPNFYNELIDEISNDSVKYFLYDVSSFTKNNYYYHVINEVKNYITTQDSKNIQITVLIDFITFFITTFKSYLDQENYNKKDESKISEFYKQYINETKSHFQEIYYNLCLTNFNFDLKIFTLFFNTETEYSQTAEILKSITKNENVCRDIHYENKEYLKYLKKQFGLIKRPMNAGSWFSSISRNCNIL